MSDEATPTPVEELDDEQPIEAEAPEGLDQEALERRTRALSQVVKFGDPVLRSAASPVTEFDEGLEAEAERMIGLMRDAIGVGLAATQLGILRRMLVFQVGLRGRADGARQPRDRVALGRGLRHRRGGLPEPSAA